MRLETIFRPLKILLSIGKVIFWVTFGNTVGGTQKSAEIITIRPNWKFICRMD
jgi:hypothetical protein